MNGPSKSLEPTVCISIWYELLNNESFFFLRATRTAIELLSRAGGLAILSAVFCFSLHRREKKGRLFEHS